MSGFVDSLSRVYCTVFKGIEKLAGDWFLGLFARLTFASVLVHYFWKSGATKLGDGFFGFLSPSTGAYAQILPKLTEEAGYDISQIAYFPYGLIVLFGTWAEFILPALIVVGLFTRATSFAFIGFLAVMTIVDITGHGVDATVIGAFFDRNPSSIIADQRLLWVFLLAYLGVKGGGAVSLDRVLCKVRSA